MNGGCHPQATCTNLPGTFRCDCQLGYAGDGGSCSDVDECLMSNGGCHAQALCTNLPGSRSCVCNVGYSGDGGACLDFDECQVSNGGCHSQAVCTNLPGTRSCACGAGWQGDGGSCTDINECLAANGGCHVQALCTNTAGSRTCSCFTGFTGDGGFCQDLNECLTMNGGCDPFGVCTNTDGGRTCACPTGFTGNGLSCTDVNECAIDGGCDSHATCTNTPGSHTCTCNAGYAGNGATCAVACESTTPPVYPAANYFAGALRGVGTAALPFSLADGGALRNCGDYSDLALSLPDGGARDGGSCGLTGSQACLPDAVYSISPTGVAYNAWCEMGIDRGGWTLVFATQLAYPSWTAAMGHNTTVMTSATIGTNEVRFGSTAKAATPAIDAILTGGYREALVVNGPKWTKFYGKPNWNGFTAYNSGPLTCLKNSTGPTAFRDVSVYNYYNCPAPGPYGYFFYAAGTASAEAYLLYGGQGGPSTCFDNAGVVCAGGWSGNGYPARCGVLVR